MVLGTSSSAICLYHGSLVFRPLVYLKNTNMESLTLACSYNREVMSSSDNDKDLNPKPKVVVRFRLFKVYEGGKFEIRFPTEKILPLIDPITGVQSRDIVISTSTSLPISARIFIPPNLDKDTKLPLLYYIHCGGFCMQSAFAPVYHKYLNSLVAEARVIAISIEYRLYQESPLPACYEDTWAGLQWVAAHTRGVGPIPLLNACVDNERLFVAGDSAGANMAHYVAVQAAKVGLKISGLVLAHSFFGGTDDDKIWLYMCPTNSGPDDPRLRPNIDDLAKLGCERVLVCKGGRDPMGVAAKKYCEELKKSGWKGTLEFVENKGKGHAFYFRDAKDQEALLIQDRICMFINEDTRSKLVRYSLDPIII